MQVKEIMSQPVTIINTEASLIDAAALMRERNVGVLPAGTDGVVNGLLTDRDIVVRAVAEGRDLAGTKVGDIVTGAVATCQDSDDVDIAAKQMADHQVGRLLVLNDDGKMVGLVSLGDMALETAKPELIGSVLSEVASRAVKAK